MHHTFSAILKRASKIYRENPYVALLPYAVTRPKDFRNTYAFLKKTESWSSDQIINWQFEKVRDIVLHAYANVQFYHDAYKKEGFEPGDFKSIEVMKKLPTITKQIIKNQPNSFIAKNIAPRDYFSCQTSGSTASPMQFYQDYSIMHADTAFHYYIWEKHGYRMGQKCIVIRGNKIAQLDKLVFHTYDRIANYKIFDSDYLNTDYLPYYDKEIRRFGADVLFGYPSSIFSLARAYELTGIQPPRFSIVVMSSESVYEDQLAFIRKMFSADIVTFNYGHSERVLLGSKYMENNRTGFFPQYGYFELLDPQGNSVPSPCTVGEITGTGFSKSMPLIRYRTDDYALSSTYKSNDFMKHCSAVERIEGRLQEFIVTSDYRLISLVSVAGAHLEELCVLMDMQYQQDCIGELLVKGVENPCRPITQSEIDKILWVLEKKFENKIRVRFQKVNCIKRTSVNKKVMLIQNLEIGSLKPGHAVCNGA